MYLYSNVEKDLMLQCLLQNCIKETMSNHSYELLDISELKEDSVIFENVRAIFIKEGPNTKVSPIMSFEDKARFQSFKD